MKRICSSVALMMVAASAASTPGDSESLLPGNLPPCVAPAGDASDTEFDPCMISPVFSGCISTREALKVSQQALAAERSVTGQYRALMSVKNEQSRRYIATLDELSAVREKLDRCEATRGVAASNAISLAAVPDDTSSHPAGASGLAGELSKAQDILPNSRVAYPDYVSQIRALRAENRSLRLSLIAKDDQLVAGQKEVERPVADTAELEAPVKGVSLDIDNYCTIRASPACQRRFYGFCLLVSKIKGRDCGTINGHDESLSIRALMKDAREALVR